jgi:hypothetical protein
MLAPVVRAMASGERVGASRRGRGVAGACILETHEMLSRGCGMRPDEWPEDGQLSAEQMLRLYAEKVQRLYGMTLDEYHAAKAAGRLPERPRAAVAALEVFSGEGSSRVFDPL